MAKSYYLCDACSSIGGEHEEYTDAIFIYTQDCDLCGKKLTKDTGWHHISQMTMAKIILAFLKEINDG